MFIHVGYVENNLELGWIALFCPSCGEVAPARVVDVGRRLCFNHTIPLARREHQSYESTCEECGHQAAPQSLDHRGISRDRAADAEQLFNQLSTSAQDDLYDIVKQESRAWARELTEEERRRLALEALVSADFQPRRTYWPPRFDYWESWVFAIGAIGTILLAFRGESHEDKMRIYLFWGGLVVVSVIARALTTRMFYGRQLRGPVARRMVQIAATSDDLEYAVGAARRRGLAIARYASVAGLLAAMAKFDAA